MSLIIGACCNDGLVLGADDAANYAMARRATIRAAYKKIRIVDGRSAISVASTVGVLQQYEEVLSQTHTGAFSELRTVPAMNRLRDRFVETTNVQFQVASMIQNEIGSDAWTSSVGEALVATDVAGAYRLYHYDQKLSPQEICHDLPFVSIGSGQTTADPFLLHLKRIYCPDQAPDIALATMLVLWAIKHAGETGAPHVGMGRQIVTLTGTGNSRVAQELTLDQLQEHYEFIDSAENSMRSMRKMISQSVNQGLPAPPSHIETA